MEQIGIGIDVGGTAVKVAAVDGGGRVLWAERSDRYHRPTPGQLTAAIRQAARRGAGDALNVERAAVGLCVPGLLDETRSVVRRSVNVPGLDGVRLADLVGSAFSASPASVFVATDAYATAFDLYALHRPAGRMFVLAIGTGVGAAVLDEGRPLLVDGDSPGHFGQIDVSLEGQPVVGPDGGAGSLEGYLSAAALAERFGADPSSWVTHLRADDPPMRALVRAIRIAHALYRPQRVYLAGGIGIRLCAQVPDLHRAVAQQLTNIARPGWTLSCAPSDFHAAQGAARLAIASIP